MIHTKHINTLAGQNLDFLANLGGTYSNHWAEDISGICVPNLCRWKETK